MKQINRYFISGCIAYTVMTVIISILHMMDHQAFIYVKSLMQVFFIIMLIQTVLLIMENIPVKSQYLHVTYEFTIILVITITVGIPIKAITDISIGTVAELIFIIAITYSIIILSLYIDSKRDAAEINRKLLGKH